jgi:hypothetical protein
MQPSAAEVETTPCDLLRESAAAQARARFEQQDREVRMRETAGGADSGGPGAYDHNVDVPIQGGFKLLSHARRRAKFSPASCAQEFRRSADSTFFVAVISTKVITTPSITLSSRRYGRMRTENHRPSLVGICFSENAIVRSVSIAS